MYQHCDRINVIGELLAVKHAWLIGVTFVQ